MTAFVVLGMPSPLTDAEGRPSLLSLGGGLLIMSVEGGGGAWFAESSLRTSGRSFLRSLAAGALASSTEGPEC